VAWAKPASPAVSPWGRLFLPGGSGLLRLDAYGRKIWEACLPAKAASQPVFFIDGSNPAAAIKSYRVGLLPLQLPAG